jgi:hypothetical protein
VANTLNLFRNGAVGFIDGLDGTPCKPLAQVVVEFCAVKIGEVIFVEDLRNLLLKPRQDNMAPVVVGEADHLRQMQHDIHVECLVFLGNRMRRLKLSAGLRHMNTTPREGCPLP